MSTPTNSLQPATQHTCTACRLYFKDATEQKEHYKKEFHRFNLRRKTVGLTPVTEELYSSKEKQLIEQQAAEKQKKDFVSKCATCRKTFKSENQYNTHLQSKKHRDNEKNKAQEEADKRAEKEEKRKSQEAKTSDEDDESESDSDESGPEEMSTSTTTADSKAADPDAKKKRKRKTEAEMEAEMEAKLAAKDYLKPNQCLFCTQEFKSLADNVRHMVDEHSFWIPDEEYLQNLEGLIDFLAQKISIGYMCIWCNEKSRNFHSLKAVRRHMTDLAHCRMAYEEEDLDEYIDFYDFSKQDTQITLINPVESEDGYSLYLGDKKAIGHRALLPYYKQRVRRATVASKVINKHRALTYEATEQLKKAQEQNRRYRDREDRKLERVGVRANKLQKYARHATNDGY